MEKECHEMTISEFCQFQGIRLRKVSHQKRNNTIKWWKRIIEGAIAEGKAIPEEVIAEYGFQSRTTPGPYTW